MQVLQNDFGNPSSTHSFGRSSKTILETSRKTIAKLIGCAAQELIFTSNATEATNWILKSAVTDLKVQRIITSKIEHHATLYTVKHLQQQFGIEVDFISILPSGAIDMTHLVDLLSKEGKTLVTLMHVNNEIGTVLDLEKQVEFATNTTRCFIVIRCNLLVKQDSIYTNFQSILW